MIIIAISKHVLSTYYVRRVCFLNLNYLDSEQTCYSVPGYLKHSNFLVTLDIIKAYLI